LNIIKSKDGSFSLEQLDAQPINSIDNEIRVFIVARNERTRLPYLLSYYRGKGINKFFMIDDRSDDGTREYMLSQPDCHVFHPSNSFKEARAGVNWQNLLLDIYGTGYWTIVIDADELLVYPQCEKVSLPDFCRFLDSEGSTSFFAFMLDMYPDGDLTKGECIAEKPFTEICPLFDKDYKFREISTRTSAIEELPRVRVVGGPRIRKFYPWQFRTDFASRALATVIIKIAEKMKFWKGDKPHYAPALIKVPLVKWQQGCKRLSNHVVTNPPGGKISSVTGVLLHFKFFADFHAKAKKEVARNQHFGGSQEYRRYLKYIARYPNFTFKYSGSREYKDSNSLLKERLIITNAEYDAWIQNISG